METLTFPGRYESLANISNFVKKVAKSNGFEGLALYKIETAVDEACSNIIEHAYGEEDKGDIKISIDFLNEALTITIKDKGKPFDPEKVKQPNLNDPLEERKGNGLGLYMMKQWMDEVHFVFNKQENVLTMIKYKGSPID
jgi:serine/threonine-protein kinase RsbW